MFAEIKRIHNQRRNCNNSKTENIEIGYTTSHIHCNCKIGVKMKKSGRSYGALCSSFSSPLVLC